MTYSITRTITGHGTTKTLTQSTQAFDGGKPIDVTVPAGTEVEVTLVLTRANLKGLAMWVNGILTVKTNSSGSPQDTIDMATNEVIVWDPQEGRGLGSCPFSGNITKLFLDNNGGSDVQFLGWFGEDVTP
jgi:hypothetical protein